MHDTHEGPPAAPEPFVLSTASLVRDVVLHVPGASRAMERFRIDYCCGGERSLEAACAGQASVVDLLGAIEEERKKGGEADAVWLRRPLGELIEHIKGVHHASTRAAEAQIAALLASAEAAPGPHGSAIAAIAPKTLSLFAALRSHLREEESVLFPHVVALEHASATNGRVPVALFSSTRAETRDLEHEHEREEERVAEVRRLTGDFAQTDATPAAVRELYAAFEAFEQDLQRHMHLESNILFPRAVWLEEKLLGIRC